MLDLNKTLKEVSEQCQDIWKGFKKITDGLSTFPPKKEAENIQIPFLVTKIKTLKADLENNKFVLSKFNPAQNKSDNTPVTASWVKPQEKSAKVEEPKPA